MSLVRRFTMYRGETSTSRMKILARRYFTLQSGFCGEKSLALSPDDSHKYLYALAENASQDGNLSRSAEFFPCTTLQSDCERLA